MGIWQPRVQRREPRLGAEPDDHKRPGHPRDRRVKRAGVRGQHPRVERGGLGQPAVPRRRVQDHDAEQGQGDSRRADHGVLPRGLDGGASAAVADEEGGHDRGRLDRHPRQPEVRREGGQAHRGEEALHQDAVATPGAGGPLAEVCRGRRAGQGRHRADDDDQECPQPVGVQPPAEHCGLAMAGHPGRQRDAAGRDHQRGGRAEVGRGAPPSEQRVPGSGQQGRGDREDEEGRAHVSPAAPASRQGRCRRRRCASGRPARPGQPWPAAGRTTRPVPPAAAPRRRRGTRPR